MPAIRCLLIPAMLLLYGAVFPGPLRGDGVTLSTSSVDSTGQLSPMRQTKIALAEEDLHITLDGDFATVRVHYPGEPRWGGKDDVRISRRGRP